MPTAKKEIRDRNALTDHIASVMHEQCPSWSVDTLMAHPIDMLAATTEIGRRASKFTDRKRMKRFAGRIAALAEEFGPEIDVTQEIGRVMINARKRGQLRRDKA